METRKLRRTRWATVMLVAALAATVTAISPPARAGDDYPYKGEDPSGLDPRGFYYRNCTSFVAWRMSLRGEFSNYMRGGHWWHARNWADNAQRIGVAVDGTPAPGAIAHWYAGEGGAESLGHVAVVQSVNADGTVTVEEYNGLNDYDYSRRAGVRAPRYIHLYDDAPASRPAQPAEPKAAPAARTPPEPPAAAAAPAAPARLPEEQVSVPVGRVTAPSENEQLHSGRTVTVSGEFEDDSRVSKVYFFAADQNYRWTLIGSDEHGGNGTYSVPWKVAYPGGSRVSVYAEAFDDQGHQAVDSIRGLEGIRIVGAERLAAAGASERTVDGALDDSGPTDAARSAHRGSSSSVSSANEGMSRGVLSLAVLVLLIFGLIFGFFRLRKRATVSTPT